MPGTIDDVARVIVREVPLGRLSSLVGTLPGRPGGGTAMGDGCGGGCGGGAGCMDPNGITGLTNQDIQNALRDQNALKAALQRELQGQIGRL